MRRLLILLLMLIGTLIAACGAASTPSPTAAPKTEAKPAASPATEASPGASPVVRASPSPSPAAAGAAGGSGTWASIRDALTSNTTLVSIGVILVLLAVIAWKMSNRAEATPNEDQLLELRQFVNDHFAKYVARGLAGDDAAPMVISKDAAWRKVFIQHLRLHNELYAFREDIALRLFDAEVDEAVRREIEALRASGQRPAPTA